MKTLYGKRLLWVLLISVLLGSAFFVGRMTVNPSLDGSQLLSLPDNGPYQSEHFCLVVQRILQRPNYHLESPSDIRDEELKEIVNELIQMDDLKEQKYRADLLCRVLPLERTFFMLKYLLHLDQTLGRETLLQAFLEAWGRMDPESALAFASKEETSLDRRAAVDTVLKGWAQKDPLAAWDAVLKSRIHREAKMSRLKQILGWTFSAGDLDKVSELIAAVQSVEIRDDLQAYFAYLRGDNNELSEAVKMALLIEDKDLRLDTLAVLSRKWAAYNPTEAIAWAGTISDPYTLSFVLVSISEGWASYNPELTADWALGLEGTLRSDCIEAIIDVWLSQEDDSAVSAWLLAHMDGRDFDAAIMTYVDFLSDYSYEEAMTWAMMLYDGDTRVDTVSQLADEWLSYDPDMAADFILSQKDMSREFKALLLGDAMLPQVQELESRDVVMMDDLSSDVEISSSDEGGVEKRDLDEDIEDAVDVPQEKMSVSWDEGEIE